MKYAQKAPVTTIFELGDISYLTATKSLKATLPRSAAKDLSVGSSVALTVLDVDCAEEELTPAALESTIASYLSKDDVFTEDFLEGVYLMGASFISDDVVSSLNEMGVKHVVYGEGVSSTSAHLTTFCLTLPLGPYLLTVQDDHLGINSVYRLYSDENRTLMYGTYQESDDFGNYTELDHSINAPLNYLAVPVPSRLHYLRDERPFAGYCLGVEDIYDMKGLTTTGGSLAWARYNTPADATAISANA